MHLSPTSGSVWVVGLFKIASKMEWVYVQSSDFFIDFTTHDSNLIMALQDMIKTYNTLKAVADSGNNLGRNDSKYVRI